MNLFDDYYEPGIVFIENNIDNDYVVIYHSNLKGLYEFLFLYCHLFVYKTFLFIL